MRRVPKQPRLGFGPKELRSGTAAWGAGVPRCCIGLCWVLHPALRCLAWWWGEDCGVFFQTVKDLVAGNPLLWGGPILWEGYWLRPGMWLATHGL